MKVGMSRNKCRMSLKIKEFETFHAIGISNEIQGIALGSNFVIFLDKVDTYAKQPKTLR